MHEKKLVSILALMLTISFSLGICVSASRAANAGDPRCDSKA